MSLARLAMRVAAARAIRGATLAEDRVYDSAIDPIDHAVLETRQPFVVVSTEDHDVTVTGRDLFYGAHECKLMIETAVASRVEIDGEDGLTIPHTDEGMEIVLDILEHQIIASLTRERTAWSRVFTTASSNILYKPGTIKVCLATILAVSVSVSVSVSA